MKALGLVVSDKKIFESFILKTYFLTPWPTYAFNWNGLNNFDRGPPRDHSCEVWSISNKRFQRRCSWKKLLTDARTHARTHRRRTPDIEGSQKLTEHFMLRWAKNPIVSNQWHIDCFQFRKHWSFRFRKHRSSNSHCVWGKSCKQQRFNSF